MWRGVRWYLLGSVGLGVLGALAGCSGGNYFAEREPWRHQAEAQCINSGSIHEGVGKVRITAINGPGMCGADFPLKVSSLGDSSALGFGDELRPPGSIPNASGATPRWPVSQSRPAPTPSYEPSYEPNYASPSPYPPQYPPPVEMQPLPAPPRAGDVAPRYDSAPGYEQPLPLDPPPNAASGPTYQPYDFRKPFGALPPPPARAPVAATPRERSSPAYDLSPVPYERRRVIGEQDEDSRFDPAAETRRVLERQPKKRVPERAPEREPPPIVPLGPTRGPQVAAGGPVSVSPAATLACPLVSALDRWIAESVQPAAMRWFGQPVVEIRQISAYSCRGMNGNPNAHISEHAFGNALDIASFTLADGYKLTVEKGWHGKPEEQGFLRDVQGAACDQFTTVLAPGSNRFHYNHIHVDLMRRKGGRRACNPRAVSGEEIAARARATYAAKHGGEPSVTGSIGKKRTTSSAKRIEPNAYADEWPDRDLPLAQPGADGED